MIKTDPLQGITMLQPETKKQIRTTKYSRVFQGTKFLNNHIKNFAKEHLTSKRKNTRLVRTTDLDYYELIAKTNTLDDDYDTRQQIIDNFRSK